MGYVSGIRWSDSLIEEEIYKIVEDMGTPHMPSTSELNKMVGNYSLSNAIAKHGGFNYWAIKLNLPQKFSETKLGIEFEEICKNQLKDRGYNSVELTPIKFPYDILIDNSLKIDVKCANLYVNSKDGYSFYTFNLEHNKPYCDIYICYTLKNDGSILNTYIIPSKFLKIQQLTIAGNKYDKYKNRWDYVDKYLDFYKEIK